MNGYDMLFLINGIQNTPVSDGILDQTWEVGVHGVVTKVRRIRREPFGLIQQPLGLRWFGSAQIIEDGRQIGDTIPGHEGLPAEAELFSDLIPGHPV